jgi:hypothetical protein
MRPFKYFCIAIALIFPALLYAGQIYGTVTSEGKGVPQANIEINCSGATTMGATRADGSYRINVPQQGQCTLTLPNYAGRPSAVIFSNPNPASYSFELVRGGDGNYTLRIR